MSAICCGVLPGAEHHLGQARAQRAVGVDARVGHVHERQPRELLERSVGIESAAPHALEQIAHAIGIHARARYQSGQRERRVRDLSIAGNST